MTLLAIFAVVGHAHAQLHKCTAPNGKITYSDVVCNTNAITDSIKNPYGNSIDTSALRQEMKKNREENEADESRATATARQSPPQECKFAYFSIGDEKGKRLAANAKAECFQNNEARLNGLPISLEHYTFWNDHYSRKSNNRQAAITRANSDANSWLTKNAIDNAASDIKNKTYNNKTYKCKPNYSGTELNCN